MKLHANDIGPAPFNYLGYLKQFTHLCTQIQTSLRTIQSIVQNSVLDENVSGATKPIGLTVQLRHINRGGRIF
jgi:hypothetical protein